MPDFVSTILLVVAAALAGYDIIMKAVEAVESGNYFDMPVIVVLTAVLAFFIGFGIEGTALVLLYQIGMLLLNYAKDHTRKAALDLLRDQDDGIAAHMREIVMDEEKTAMSIQQVMSSSAGMVLKLAMLLAVIYAIAMPIITSMSFSVSIHRALIILLVATPFSVVTAIPGPSAFARAPARGSSSAMLKAWNQWLMFRLLSLTKTESLPRNAPGSSPCTPMCWTMIRF